MKLPITEQFLWDIYHAIAASVDAVPEFYPYPTIKTVLIGRNNSVERRYMEKLGREKFGKLINSLKRRGYIRIKNLEDSQAMMLTKEGMGKVLRASFNREGKTKRQDGKWIMIVFDIPRNKLKDRELLRSVLRGLGYKLFQQSVWVTPFDVSDTTERMMRFYSLDSYVKMFLIEKM
ncbi:MAG: hypothetical protein ACREHG_06085 [Candidatus Saccharimonadales bacterium]